MNAKNLRRVFASCCVAAAALMMTGCDPAAGAAVYEVIYPSGYARDYLTGNEEIPVEGTSWQLRWEQEDDEKKTQDRSLQIVDEDGLVLYEYPAAKHNAARGSLQGDQRVWVCTELWTSPHRDYLEGWLKESDLRLIDLSDGGIVFQGKAGENEFYLTSSGTRCYFYHPGKEAGEKLFGLIRVPAEQAELYYRDTADWSEKHTAYTFDYEKEPEIDTGGGVETRLRFYISGDRIRVVWTSYESVGNGNWEYLEKAAYEVPIGENDRQEKRD